MSYNQDAAKFQDEIFWCYISLWIPTSIDLLKLSFRNTLIITGAMLTGIGAFAIFANSLPIIDVPDHSYEGNIITGVILFSIGIYIILLGILDNPR